MIQLKKKVPELRFKGFTDEWEQRSWGDEVRIVMGQSPNSENYTDDPTGAKNAKTYEDLVCISQTKIQKKWYMIMTMKQSKIKPSDLRKHPDDHETLIKHKVNHVSSCQKLKLILQPGNPQR